MNAKKLCLFGIIAAICLPASATLAGSRSSHSSVSASRAGMSRPAFTASRGGFSSAQRIGSNRAAFAHRFNQGVGSSRISANRAGLASSRRWSGNGNGNGNWHRHHRHHHHNNFVFVGGFYPYSWYYPWYDDYYGYYSSGPAVYDSSASYDDGSLVAQLQSRLAGRGYYRGAVDGVMGPETRRAIRAFERAKGLPVDGLIDDQLLSTMGLG